MRSMNATKDKFGGKTDQLHSYVGQKVVTKTMGMHTLSINEEDDSEYLPEEDGEEEQVEEDDQGQADQVCNDGGHRHTGTFL